MACLLLAIAAPAWHGHAPLATRPLHRPPRASGPAAAVSELDECLVEAPDGAAAEACALPDPAYTLQRYLQLRTVLSGEPLPDETVSALIRQVEAVGAESFDERRILGEWQLCWQKNTAKATKSQRALAPLPQFSNFMTDASGTKIFRNIVQLTKRRVRVVADVAYEEPGLARPSGAVRLGSTIRAAAVEVSLGRRWGWKPVRVPLPLRGEGWLDVTYLSDAMRITRGNRGGVFVHVRPSLLTEAAAWPARGGTAGPHRMAGRWPPPKVG